ncbi:hypothetical protein G9U51_08380 [Calidifontibacter sp. DB0510]|uniref:HNH endonuclease n=1 Tax=Metallococcus carri TaxID=1656884 RepID=A0A967B0F9_9MICO|nr:hypothetical protein [Metallococcus carri]NHN55792.1 hypothetical protein [Metallococcus carri]NOP38519.1 hypothetical protein [Calidifontibacter sp. DB2511S]
MPWLRLGDNAATHPLVTALAGVPGSDDRTINEVFGFVVRCATLSAGHMTDYRIDLGTAQLLAGPRASKLLKQAVAAGLMTSTGLGRSRYWQLVEDPDLWHMRSKEEIDWERRRKVDNGNPKLTVPVRLRDGDACRYCRRIVQWGSNRNDRGGTYDHRVPGQGAESPDDLFVSCRACNGRRGDDPAADTRVPRHPAPVSPFYSPATVEWLASKGVTVKTSGPPTGELEKRAPDRRARSRQRDPWETSPDTAHPQERPDDHRTSDPASLTRGDSPPAPAGGQEREPDPGPGNAQPSERPGTPGPGIAAPTQGHDPPPGGPAPPTWARAAPEDSTVGPNTARIGESEDYGPGRVGTGRDGTGAAPAPAGVPALNRSSPAPSRPRSRRGRRGRS